MASVKFDELHIRAMDCAERGESLLMKNPQEARQAYVEGLSWELRALDHLGQADDLTLAVFIRSAVALALGAQKYEDVRRLVERGLQVAPQAMRAEFEALLAGVPVELDKAPLKASTEELSGDKKVSATQGGTSPATDCPGRESCANSGGAEGPRGG